MQSWAKTKVQCLVRNTHSGVYYARARVNGKLHWKTLQTDILTVAKARLPKALTELGRKANKQVGSNLVIVTFGDAATVHLANIVARVDCKPTTKHYWHQIVDALLVSWPELPNTRISRISENDCRDWAAKYKDQVSPTRFNNTVDCLRAIFALGIKAGAIHENPAAELGKAKVRGKQLELPSKTEFAEIVKSVRTAGAWCSKQCGDLVEFLAYTGCRLSEAGFITWNDVDLAASTIWIHGDPLTGTKNWDRRQIPVFPALGRLLADLRDQPRPIRDPNRRGGEKYVLAVTECQKAIDKACTKLGIKRITHHDLRHVFATVCIESGVDVPTLSRWLGHKDGGVLAMKTYGHLRSENSLQMAKKVNF
jgi:integrase